MVVRVLTSLGQVFVCLATSGLAAAHPAWADAPNLERLGLEEVAKQVGLTGESNIVVFVVVSVLGIVGAFVIHFVHLLPAMVLVVLLPGLAGVGAALTTPKADVPDTTRCVPPSVPPEWATRYRRGRHGSRR